MGKSAELDQPGLSRSMFIYQTDEATTGCWTNRLKARVERANEQRYSRRFDADAIHAVDGSWTRVSILV